MISKKPKYLRPRILVLVTSEARNNPKIKAIKEAKRGIPHVYPNPAVGCVIHDGSKILSTGYHKMFGGNHAEYDALQNLDKSARGLTMYVSLEPCAHVGKTGACSDLIDPKIFKRIVIAEKDPNKKAHNKRALANLRLVLIGFNFMAIL